MSPEGSEAAGSDSGAGGTRGAGSHLLDKLVYPVLSSVTSAVAIGLLLGVFIDGRMAKWQKLSDFQLEREKQAHILLFDAFTTAELDLLNFEQGHISKPDKLEAELDTLIDEEARQVAYVSEDLDKTYVFVHTRMLTRLLLAEKERKGEDTTDAVQKVGEDIDEGKRVLLAYMKLWHAGKLDKAEAELKPYIEQRVTPRGDAAFDEVTALLAEKEAAEAEAEAQAAGQ